MNQFGIENLGDVRECLDVVIPKSEWMYGGFERGDIFTYQNEELTAGARIEGPTWTLWERPVDGAHFTQYGLQVPGFRYYKSTPEGNLLVPENDFTAVLDVSRIIGSLAAK